MTEVFSIRGNLVLRDRVVRGVLFIAGGRIVGIEEGVSEGANSTTLDYGEFYVLPGLIEVHGHMREPGFTHKEDRVSGTRAAVAGGFTTILDMPNTAPPTITRQLLKNKIRCAEGRSYCDYGFIFGGAPDNYAELEAVDPQLIVGVKFFTAGHETTPTVISDLGALYGAFEILARRDLLALVHAENQQLINYLGARWFSTDAADGLAYSRARGEVVATTAVLEAISLAKFAGNRLYLCHLSTGSELAAVAWAKEQHLPVFAELASYHLLLNTNHYESLDTLLKVSPAIRDPEQQDSLWEALDRGGLVDVVCSEHTPHTLEEKQKPMRHAVSGMPGIQEALPALFTTFRYRYPEYSSDLCLIKLARLMSTNVANVFGLQDKGEIQVGKDADLVVVDADAVWKIEPQQLISKCGWSAYEGWQVRGVPVSTFLRGRRVFHRGQVKGDPAGKMIERKRHDEPLALPSDVTI